VQWTVDDLDSGGGLMTNKNKSLESGSDGDVFAGMVPYLHWVTHGGSGESSILVQKLNYLKKFSRKSSGI